MTLYEKGKSQLENHSCKEITRDASTAIKREENQIEFL